MIPLEEDNYLKINLLHFSQPTARTERFYFSEMSTLQATRFFPPDRKIALLTITVYTEDNFYLDENTIGPFNTIGHFNDFFRQHPDYDNRNCRLELENGLIVSSHDDGEVSIQLPENGPDQSIIDQIFNHYHLDRSLMDELKSKPGHYLAIDQNARVTGDFKDFDDYLKYGR